MQLFGKIAIVCAFTVLSACAPTNLVPLSGDEIHAELAGNNFRYAGSEMTAFIFSGFLTVQENGLLEFNTDRTGPESGTWRIADDAVCITLQVLLSGEERCFGMSRSGPDTFKTSDGYVLIRQ